MVRNTVPPPRYRWPKSFQIVDKLNKKMILHYCDSLADGRFVDIDFPGNCNRCGKNYAFEALKDSLGVY